MTRIDSASPYRVQGTMISIAELAKSKPGFVISATPEQLAELKLREEQEQVRAAAVASYAKQNPDQVYAQIILPNGQVFATVRESGSTRTPYEFPGLIEDGAGVDLAEKRLAQIAKAVGGEVNYSDLPSTANAGATIPDSVMENMPQVTARNLTAILQSMDWSLARSRITGPEPAEK